MHCGFRWFVFSLDFFPTQGFFFLLNETQFFFGTLEKCIEKDIALHCVDVAAPKGAFTLRLLSAPLMTVTEKFRLFIWDSWPKGNRNFPISDVSCALKCLNLNVPLRNYSTTSETWLCLYTMFFILCVDTEKAFLNLIKLNQI